MTVIILQGIFHVILLILLRIITYSLSTEVDLGILFVVAGIPEGKLMEAHGSFAIATCRVCYKSYTGEEIKVNYKFMTTKHHAKNLSQIT